MPPVAAPAIESRPARPRKPALPAERASASVALAGEVSRRERALLQLNRKLRADGKPQLGVRIDPVLNGQLTDFCSRNRRYGLDFQTKEQVVEHVLRQFLRDHDTPERFAPYVELERQQEEMLA